MLGSWEEIVVIARQALWMLENLSEGADRSAAMYQATIAFHHAGLLPPMVDRSGLMEFVSDLIAENELLADRLWHRQISASGLQDVETFEDLIARLTLPARPSADKMHQPRPRHEVVASRRIYPQLVHRRSTSWRIGEELDTLIFGEAVTRIVTELSGTAGGSLAFKKIRLPDGREAIFKMEISTQPKDLERYRWDWKDWKVR